MNSLKQYRSSEISMGSMADIAFLLLIFFLVAATLDTDKGLIRKLPPYDHDADSTSRKERNILIVLVNRHDQLMVEGEHIPLEELRQKAKEFIQNKNNEAELPELYPVQIDYFGEVMISRKHIISLCSDRGTSYDMYIAVQNELAAAYSELRDELSAERFGMNFDDLKGETGLKKRKAIETIYPMKISEAEPN